MNLARRRCLRRRVFTTERSAGQVGGCDRRLPVWDVGVYHTLTASPITRACGFDSSGVPSTGRQKRVSYVCFTCFSAAVGCFCCTWKATFVHYMPDDYYLRDDVHTLGMSQFSCRLYVGRRRFQSAAPIVHALRQHHGLTSDMMTDPSWLLSRAAVWRNSPLAVVLERNGYPAAAVLLYGRNQFGLPTGVIKGGNLSGDGIVVAAAGQRVAAVQTAAAAVLRLPWVHTVMTSVRGAGSTSASTLDAAPVGCGWFGREVSTDLSLEGGFEGFLSRLRPRSRRNYYYFRRRAERELGLSFVPNLQADDAIRAVEELHGASMYPAPRGRSRRFEAAIRQTPGSFAMGVRTPAGQWVSYLSGWRQKEGTFVEWQLNRHELMAASLSTVMRTYFLEHEAARGVKRVVFVGGTSDALGRYCAPDGCLDLIATRTGIRGWLGQKLMLRMRPQGHVAMLIRSAALAPVTDQA